MHLSEAWRLSQCTDGFCDKFSMFNSMCFASLITLFVYSLKLLTQHCSSCSYTSSKRLVLFCSHYACAVCMLRPVAFVILYTGRLNQCIFISFHACFGIFCELFTPVNKCVVPRTVLFCFTCNHLFICFKRVISSTLCTACLLGLHVPTLYLDHWRIDDINNTWCDAIIHCPPDSLQVIVIT